MSIFSVSFINHVDKTIIVDNSGLLTNYPSKPWAIWKPHPPPFRATYFIDNPSSLFCQILQKLARGKFCV